MIKALMIKNRFAKDMQCFTHVLSEIRFNRTLLFIVCIIINISKNNNISTARRKDLGLSVASSGPTGTVAGFTTDTAILSTLSCNK